MIEPKWINEIKNPKALLVVAHPDDETIFAGGLILTSQDTQWTIICCKYEEEPRQHEFRRACDFLAKNSGNQIEPIVVSKELNYREIVDELRRHEVSKYDIVFTHNYMGEYGNEDHKYVLRSIIETIDHPNTWLFISPGSCNVNQDEFRSKIPNGNKWLDLPLKILNLKKRAFQECHITEARKYGYDYTGYLRNGSNQLRPTLLWSFEAGSEQYTFFDAGMYKRFL